VDQSTRLDHVDECAGSAGAVGDRNGRTWPLDTAGMGSLHPCSGNENQGHHSSASRRQQWWADARSIINYNDPILIGATVSGSQSETRVGWAAGVGVNYAAIRNWIVGVNYLHYDLGHMNVTGFTVPPGTIIPSASLTASQNVGGDIGVNYQF
jgi:opacity protein-like surface antigen